MSLTYQNPTTFIQSNVKRIIECSDKINTLATSVDCLISTGENDKAVDTLSQLGYVSEQLGSDVSALMDMLGD